MKLNINTLLIQAVLLGTACLFTISCEKEVVNNTIKNKKNIPSEKIYNAKITEKDSGRIKYHLTAPLIEKYGFLETPVTLFRKGVHITFFKPDSSSSSLRADYAKVIEDKKWYEARGNVVAITPDGDTMRANSFYYNKKTGKIFTKDTVTIHRLDNSIIFANHGLEACDDFSCYKLFENKNSEIYLKDQLPK
ncbi:MAG: LPS export ABC transporter periplasmic protein LptC [Flavobacteriales bacterium]|nr:LPS export ABC transporter periplasmic protein LptC [Flavobacteriales bacterium]